MKRNQPGVVAASITVLLLPAALSAQSLPADLYPPAGISPAGTYIGSETDTVDSVTGALNMRIPIARLPNNRGGLPGFELALTYNSARYNYDVFLDGSDQPVHFLTQDPNAGWRYSYMYSLEHEYRPLPSSSVPCQIDPTRFYFQYVHKMTLVTPDGKRHLLRMQGQSDYYQDGYYAYDPNGGTLQGNPCGTASFPNLTSDIVYYTTDGSYLTVRVQHWTGAPYLEALRWYLYFPDGSIWQAFGFAPGTGTSIDRHGGTTSVGNIYSGGLWTTTFTDTAQRSVAIAHAGYTSPVNPSAGSFDIIQTPSPGGGTVTSYVNWKEIVGVSRYYQCSSSANCLLEPRDIVVDNIRLPNEICDPGGCNLWYQFGYNTEGGGLGIGKVSSMTTPLGAQISYSYQRDSTTLFSWFVYLFDAVKTRTLSYFEDATASQRNELTTYAIPNFITPATSSAIRSPESSPDSTTTTCPPGSTGCAEHTFFSYQPTVLNEAEPRSGLVYRVRQADGTIVERDWRSNAPAGSTAKEFVNPYIKTEYVTVGGASGQTRITDYTVDGNGNIASVTEYDWMPASSIPGDPLTRGPISGVAGAAPLRTTIRSYHYPATTSTNCFQNPSYYLCSAPYPDTVDRSAVETERIYAGAGGVLASSTQFEYAVEMLQAQFPRLLLKKKKQWDSDTGVWVTTDYSHDWTGNVTDVFDPPRADGTRSQTKYSYPTMSFGSWSTSGVLLTGVTTAFGTSVQQSTTIVPDVWTGATTGTTDPNGVSSSRYLDPLGRPYFIVEGNGSSLRGTNKTYSLQSRCLITSTDLDSPGGTLRRVSRVEHFDRVGRIWLAREVENGGIPTISECIVIPATGIKRMMLYHHSTAGRYEAQSTPYRDNDPDTVKGWTRTRFDAMGRAVEVRYFNGISKPYPWGTNNPSNGAVTTQYNLRTSELDLGSGQVRPRLVTRVTNERQQITESHADGLGRITRVVEPGNDVTDYAYTVLDDLKTVQQGVQTRQFTYNSLRRLKTANNPETHSGSPPYPVTSYQYDQAGNLISKTDPGGIMTTMFYDAQNRMTLKQYLGGGTGPVTYCYDGMVAATPGACQPANPAIPLSRGRLTEVANDVSVTTYTAFDAMGRVTANRQKTGTDTYAFSYQYNRMGGLTQVVYPSGRTVNYSYDSAGRISGATNGADGSIYATGLTYGAQGALQGMTLGNSATETRSYNSRLQLNSVSVTRTGVTLLNLQNYYCPPPAYTGCTSDNGQIGNNGNLWRQDIAFGAYGGAGAFSSVQEFDYDSRDRLTLARENSGAAWQETYGYDRYGNRTMTTTLAGSQGTPTQYNEFTNRITASCSGCAAPVYNASGSLESQPYIGQMTYDAEQRMTAMTDQGVSYAYDGEGRRVKRTTATGTTTYVYDAFGQLAAEYQTGGGSGTPGRTYVTSDHLGSTRLTTDAAGAVKRYDYTPFGDELPPGIGGRTTAMGYFAAPDGMTLRFTGEERDFQTSLDYFGARYFSRAQGRFTSPDEPFIDQDESDPQSWNLYSYVRNNPLRFTDPTGRACVVGPNGDYDDDSGGQSCADVARDNANLRPSSTTTGQGGNVLVAFGLNAAFALDAAASSYFSFLTDAMGVRPSYMQPIPTNREFTGQLAAGTVFVGTTVGGGGARSIWTSTRKLSGVRNAFAHWLKHKKDFPNLQNAKQYVEAAQDFVSNPPAGTLTKLRANGDVVLYHPGTNTFAIKTADGTPRTMFKPDLGHTYFNAQ